MGRAGASPARPRIYIPVAWRWLLVDVHHHVAVAKATGACDDELELVLRSEDSGAAVAVRWNLRLNDGVSGGRVTDDGSDGVLWVPECGGELDAVDASPLLLHVDDVLRTCRVERSVRIDVAVSNSGPRHALHALHALGTGRAFRALRSLRPLRAAIAPELLDRRVREPVLRDRVRLDLLTVDQSCRCERRPTECQKQREQRNRVMAREAPQSLHHV